VTPTDPHDEAAEARTLAVAAAERSQIHHADLHEPAHLRAASGLFERVWGRGAEAGAMLPPEVLTALAHAGGQVSGAFRDDELVGATAAFVGLAADGTTHLHSHVTGVLPSAAGAGVGRALKLHQRAWCLTRGITKVVWTFDPMVRRNAVFNLVLLGAQAVAYHQDAYGPMADERNAGLPTDRLVAEWDLLGPRVRAALTGRGAQPDVAALRRGGAEAVVDVGPNQEPVVTPTDRPRRLVRVPEDIEAIRVADPALAERWFHAIRAELGGAVTAGMRVTGFTRDGWYLLAARGGVRELSDQR
jgi:predicted GNAT superfamily acetyltransferase